MKLIKKLVVYTVQGFRGRLAFGLITISYFIPHQIILKLSNKMQYLLQFLLLAPLGRFLQSQFKLTLMLLFNKNVVYFRNIIS